jgi:hypothetical protein
MFGLQQFFVQHLAVRTDNQIQQKKHTTMSDIILEPQFRFKQDEGSFWLIKKLRKTKKKGFVWLVGYSAITYGFSKTQPKTMEMTEHDIIKAKEKNIAEDAVQKMKTKTRYVSKKTLFDECKNVRNKLFLARGMRV